MDARDVFPALAGFPSAVVDVATAARDATALRLVSKVQDLALLSQFPRLERLWCFDLDAKGASIVGSLTTLRRLYVEGIRLPSLTALAGLTELDVFSVEDCTRVASLDELTPFSGVRALGIKHFPKVRSLEPLIRFDSLRALVVAGSMWTRMTVETLEPLAQLRGLHYLHLTNLKASDESLEPLATLTELETLDLPNFYPMEEFARLSARLRKTQCGWFHPFVPLRSTSCPTCGQASLLMLTGKGKPTLCGSCDATRVRKHEEHFKEVASKAA
jgi:hypothetical protein